VQSWQSEGSLAPLIADVAQLIAVNRHNDRLLESVASQQVAQVAQTLVSKAKKVGDVTVLCAQVEASGGALRTLADQLKAELGSAIICLGSAAGGKASLLVMVSADLTPRFAAGKLVGQLAPCIAGRGGGKPEFAQAGGQDPTGLPQAFALLEAHVGKA
jgi:alanyl-tRNA synthetase